MNCFIFASSAQPLLISFCHRIPFWTQLSLPRDSTTPRLPTICRSMPTSQPPLGSRLYRQLRALQHPPPSIISTTTTTHSIIAIVSSSHSAALLVHLLVPINCLCRELRRPCDDGAFQQETSSRPKTRGKTTSRAGKALIAIRLPIHRLIYRTVTTGTIQLQAYASCSRCCAASRAHRL